MKNGHATGEAPTNQVNINPREAAMFGLQFLEQVSHTRAQRETFDIVVSMLQAIANGQVILAPSPQPAVEAATELKASEQ